MPPKESSFEYSQPGLESESLEGEHTFSCSLETAGTGSLKFVDCADSRFSGLELVDPENLVPVRNNNDRHGRPDQAPEDQTVRGTVTGHTVASPDRTTQFFEITRFEESN